MKSSTPLSLTDLGASAIPSSRVELSVKCSKLRNMDYLSKSDPFCVMYTQDLKSKQFLQFGKTEVIHDNLDPEFSHKFVIDYLFEESQKLKFEVYDLDSNSHNLADHDFIGSAYISLAEIVSSPGFTLTLNLQNTSRSGENGTVTLRAEELNSCKEICTIQFTGSNLEQKNWWGWFGKSDPFLTLSRANEDGSFTVVHRSEVIKSTLHPGWRPFSLSVSALSNCDYDRSIKVQCHDWESSGSHQFIGEFTTSLRELTCSRPNSPAEFKLLNSKKGNTKICGTIKVSSCEITKQHSFLDYVRGGMQMHFTVAIDFTASNGAPTSPQSLHYYSPHQQNLYASAISAVGGIIQSYDSDQMFPALGFGARMPDGSVSHEFALNFQPQNPFCAGMDGVLAAYYHALQCVQLYGPTNFAPVINHVARFAASVRDGSEYFVLLIITDGIITDMPQTRAAIVAASSLPMSIIIVGVGNADFDAMDELDGDDQRLSANGRYAERDIVQFVPFSKFIHGPGNMHVAQAHLAKEVLAEVPDQVLSYMKRYSIQPKASATQEPSAPVKHENVSVPFV